MDTQNKIDSLDEALRLIYLEAAKETDIQVSTKEIKYILSNDTTIQMSENRKKMLLERLKEVGVSLSFGQIVQKALDESNEKSVLEKSNLPLEVLNELKRDSIYTNNVPIIFLKNLLSILNIPFSTAEAAIKKTFEMLQRQDSIKQNDCSVFSLAYRKGYYNSRESMNRNTSKSDGKELFENKESLEKYLKRLSELMSN